MAEIQRVQLQGQSTEIIRRAKDSPQADFSGMLMEKSQSVSEQKNTDEEAVKATNQDKTQESSTEKKPVTDSAKEQESAQEGAEISEGAAEESGEETGIPAELTGEELAQLAGMMAAISQNEESAAAQQTEVMAQASEEAVEAPDGISGASEQPEGVLMDAGQLTPAAAGDTEGAEELQALADGDQKMDIRLPDQEAAEEVPQEIPDEPVVSAEKGSTENRTQTDDFSQESGSYDSAAAESMAAGQAAQDSAAVIQQEPETGHTEILKTTPETLPEDVSETIFTKLAGQQSNTTLELTLEPASLGKITIRMVYEDGKAAFTLMSDNPKTLEALSQRAGEIAQILEQKTGQETIVYVPEEPYPEQDKNQQQSGGERRQEQQNRPGQDQTETFAQQLRLGLI